MSKLLEYIDQDNCFLVVENKESRGQYCFKFDRKPNQQFWFVSIQQGTWTEKRYPAIATISVINGIHTPKKNKNCEFDYAYNCLLFIFSNLDNFKAVEDKCKIIYGKINLC